MQKMGVISNNYLSLLVQIPFRVCLHVFFLAIAVSLVNSGVSKPLKSGFPAFTQAVYQNLR
jgi:hypothetical protein